MTIQTECIGCLDEKLKEFEADKAEIAAAHECAGLDRLDDERSTTFAAYERAHRLLRHARNPRGDTRDADLVRGAASPR